MIGDNYAPFLYDFNNLKSEMHYLIDKQFV